MIFYIILFLIILAIVVWGGVTQWRFFKERQKEGYKLHNVIQKGEDGFGHQFEGTIGLIALHIAGKVNYVFNHNKKYSIPRVRDDTCEKYMKHIMKLLSEKYPQDNKNFTEEIHVHEIDKLPKVSRDDVLYTLDNGWRSHSLKDSLVNAQKILKEVCVDNNPFLPPPSYKISDKNIVIHIRADDEAAWITETEKKQLYAVIKKLQNTRPNERITIHTDKGCTGKPWKWITDIKFLNHPGTVIKGKETPVLQVFSDFIHADTLVTPDSSFSIPATWLIKDNAQIIGPGQKDALRSNRNPPKLITYADFLKND